MLFDGWDDVWRDASLAGRQAATLCARLWDWLEPVWGLRLTPLDFTHNDLNLSNVLTDGQRITSIVDSDEFGLGSRALIVVLAFDCTVTDPARWPIVCSPEPRRSPATAGSDAW